MRARTIQVIWHSKEPVLGLDFHPSNPTLLATCGGDKDVKLWEVKREADGAPLAEYKSSLGGTQAAVNAIRFSPLGDLLATGGDSGEVHLWRPVEPGQQRAALGAAEGEAATWKVLGRLSGHAGDVHDLAWSPDGSALVSGSVESIAVLWDVDARRSVCRLEAHQHYVQGVAWDPLGRLLVTCSKDRTCKVFGPKPPAVGKRGGVNAVLSSSAAGLKDFILHVTLSKRPMADNNLAGGGPPAAGLGAPPAAPPLKHALFVGEAMPSFFRRLAWSPDGSFLVVPAGIYMADQSTPPVPTTYIYARGDLCSRSDLSGPVAHLPSLARPSVAVRFSPVLYRLRTSTTSSCNAAGDTGMAEGGAPPPEQLSNEGLTAEASNPFSGLPYRMVFAVATLDSVMVYDTQTLEPLILLGGLHMADITDLAWSCDGSWLGVASQDGYCSLAVFDQGELGEPVPLEELPPQVAAVVGHAAAKRRAEKVAATAAAAAAKAAAAQQAAAQQAAAAAASTTAQEPVVITLDESGGVVQQAGGQGAGAAGGAPVVSGAASVGGAGVASGAPVSACQATGGAGGVPSTRVSAGEGAQSSAGARKRIAPQPVLPSAAGPKPGSTTAAAGGVRAGPAAAAAAAAPAQPSGAVKQQPCSGSAAQPPAGTSQRGAAGPRRIAPMPLAGGTSGGAAVLQPGTTAVPSAALPKPAAAPAATPAPVDAPAGSQAAGGVQASTAGAGTQAGSSGVEATTAVAATNKPAAAGRMSIAMMAAMAGRAQAAQAGQGAGAGATHAGIKRSSSPSAAEAEAGGGKAARH